MPGAVAEALEYGVSRGLCVAGKEVRGARGEGRLPGYPWVP
jgi:hypothetical protein